MLIAWVAVLCAIVGLVVWVVSKNTKVSEFGRILLLASLIGIMVRVATMTVRLFG